MIDHNAQHDLASDLSEALVRFLINNATSLETVMEGIDDLRADAPEIFSKVTEVDE